MMSTRPVAVHVERKVGEIVDVTGHVVDVAELVRRPPGRFVPILAGHNVELAVPVDVGESTGLARTQVDRVFLKKDFRRAAGEEECRGPEDQSNGVDRHRMLLNLRQFPALAARAVGSEQVGLFVADDLLFGRVPARSLRFRRSARFAKWQTVTERWPISSY
jgi:hypothetical protein